MSERTESSTHAWPALDGLRAVAVLLVVMHHWEIGAGFPVDRGLLGVRLFFVLSGFLITGILLRGRGDVIDPSGTAVQAPNKLRFAKVFYGRRLLRIAPIYYLTLLVLWAVDAPGVRAEVLWHAGYVSNFLVAKYNAWVGLPSHFWSLAVEEQFYLLWPWLVLFVPRRGLAWLLGGSVLTGALWRSVGVHFGLRKFALLYLLPGCLDALGMGAVFAYIHHAYPIQARRWRWGALLGGALLLAVTSAMTGGPGATALSHTLAGLKGTAYALLMGSLVSALAEERVEGRALKALVAAFSLAPLRYLGRVSYAVYLVHPLLWIALLHGWPTLHSRPAQWAIAAVLTLVVAEVSRRWIEGPINGQKRRWVY